MATSDGSDIFKCQVCQNDMLHRTPRWLNCFHSFCSQCLQNLTQECQIKCPICGKVTNLDGNNPNSLAVNSTLQEFSGVLESALKRKRAKVSDESSRSLCHICQTADVEFHCKDCGQLMCNSCNKGHGSIEDMKGHFVVSLCAKHEDWLTHICKECVLPLCMKCMVLDHQVHNQHFVPYNKGIQDLKIEMVSLSQKVNKEQLELENCLKRIQVQKQSSAKLKGTLRTKAENYEKNIEANKIKIGELNKEIEKDEENIAETEELISELDHEIQSSEKHEREISECIEAADTMSVNVNLLMEQQTDFMSRYKTIRQDMIMSIKNMEKLVNLYPPQSFKKPSPLAETLSEDDQLSSNISSDNESNDSGKLAWLWELKNTSFSGNIAMFEEDILAVQRQAVFRLNQNGKEITKYYPEVNGEIKDFTVFENCIYILQDRWITIIDIETNEQKQALHIQLNVSKILIKDSNTIFLLQGGISNDSKVYKYYVKTGKVFCMVDKLNYPSKFEPIQTKDGIRYIITVENSRKLQLYQDLGERWVLAKTPPEFHDIKFDFTATTGRGTLLIILGGHNNRHKNYTVFHIDLSGVILSQVSVESEAEPIWPLGLVAKNSCQISLWKSSITEHVSAKDWFPAQTRSVETTKCLKIQF